MKKLDSLHQPPFNTCLVGVVKGALDYFDGISMHAYADNSIPESQFNDRVVKFNEYLKTIGADGLEQ